MTRAGADSRIGRANPLERLLSAPKFVPNAENPGQVIVLIGARAALERPLKRLTTPETGHRAGQVTFECRSRSETVVRSESRRGLNRPAVAESRPDS